MTQTLIFVEREAQVGAAAAVASADRASLCIGVSERITELLAHAGVAARWIGEYWDDALLDRIEHEAWDAADTWHRSESWAAALDYDGVSTGDMVRLYMGHYLTWLYKMVGGVRRILERESCGRIVCAAVGTQTAEGFFPAPEEWIVGRILDWMKLSFMALEPQASPRKGRPNRTEAAKARLRSLLYRIYRISVRPLQERALQRSRVALCAPIRHIRGLVETSGSSRGWAYWDEEFRPAKWLFLAKRGIPYYVCGSSEVTLEASASGRLDAFGRKLREAWQGYHRSDAPSKGAFEFEDKDVTPLVMDRLTYFFETRALEIARMMETFRAMLKAQGIQAVLVEEDSVTFRKTLVQVAQKEGVHSFQIPHGVYRAGLHHDLFPLSSQTAFLGGPAIEAWYRSKGVAPECLEVTGVPRYDELTHALRTHRERREVLRRAYGVSEERRVVLFGGTTVFSALDTRRSRREQTAAVRDFARLWESGPEPFLILRLHPLDDEPDWTLRHLRDWHKSDYLIDRHSDLFDLFAVADEVVSMPSNFVLESTVWGHPTLVFDYFRRYKTAVPGLTEGGQALFVRNYEELRRAHDALVSGAGSILKAHHAVREWLISQWVGPLDGCSAERCVQSMRRTVADSRTREVSVAG
ncbi:MAG: CDP-glycerol glycerophosphotransferase family protein [Candidatus Omnitrophica bacterium]|nr:CDP-glycerol glycerophosphotransferase family protein [Candidatus Omnitrophota bacterium]